MAADPVMPAATNLEIPIIPLQANAATTTPTELPPAIIRLLLVPPPAERRELKRRRGLEQTTRPARQPDPSGRGTGSLPPHPAEQHPSITRRPEPMMSAPSTSSPYERRGRLQFAP